MKIRQVDIKGEVYDIEAFENPIPTGTILPFAGITEPEGFLLCNGQEVSRFTYAKLYEVIGNTYGAGNGTTTFDLPNLVEKFIEGTENNIGQTVEAGLPNIKGKFVTYTYDSGDTTGAFNGYKYAGNQCAAGGDDRRTFSKIEIDAERSSAVYGKSNTVQPPAIKMKYIIKY